MQPCGQLAGMPSTATVTGAKLEIKALAQRLLERLRGSIRCNSSISSRAASAALVFACTVAFWDQGSQNAEQ